MKSMPGCFKGSADNLNGRGHARGQYGLGAMYLMGWGVLQDFAASLKWLSLAADQGDASAQNSLGVCKMAHTGISLHFDRMAAIREAAVHCGAGENTTTPNDRTVHWATAHRRQKPSSRWNPGQSCTNIQTGPLRWG